VELVKFRLPTGEPVIARREVAWQNALFFQQRCDLTV